MVAFAARANAPGAPRARTSGFPLKTSDCLRRRCLLGAAAAIPLVPLRARSQPARPSESGGTPARTRIRIVIGGTSIPVTLDDNATARDFATLLPLALVLEDYAATEKVATLPRRLSTAGAPEGTTPEAGDFSYYAPWGNLAIFHKPFRYSAGLIRLGRIDSGVEHLRVEGRLAARIEALPHEVPGR